MTFKSWFYDHFVAERYDRELAQLTEEFRQICIDRIEIKEGDVVLDLGCGTGLNQPIISEKIGTNGKIIGIDASQRMLAQAKTRATEHGYTAKLQLIQGDLRNLEQLIDSPVDAIVATLIFSVVPDWRNVFKVSFDLLKRGGGYGLVDNYWPKPGLRLWFMSWMFAADAKRPGFEPLQELSEEFVLEYHPPEAEIQFYIAHGKKAL